MTATLTDWNYYIIEPEYATNLCTNPSGEAAIAGVFSGATCTVTQSAEQARYGKYSVKGVPTNKDTIANIIHAAVTVSNGLAYTFSVSVKGEAGKSYTIRIQTTGGTDLATTTFTANGYWQRKAVSGTATTTSYNLIVSRDANQNTTAAFYTDGWLLKTGADNLYFDGDSIDPYQATKQFYWTGTPHASTSVRLASTRYGGTLLNMSSYCRVKAAQGLGLTTFATNTSGLANGGELYQNSHENAREFSLVCIAHADITEAYGVLNRKLARLQKAVNPKRMKTDQPLRLLIYGTDSAGVEASDSVLIDCIYEGGMEGDGSNRVPGFLLTFKMADPIIKADGYNVTSLTAAGTAISGGTVASIMMISDATGATETVTGFNSYVYGVTPDNNGGMYIYGVFSDYGDANGDGIVYRNSAGSISSLGTGAAGSQAVVLGMNGYTYVGSASENMGGTANADYIGYWDGSAWGALGTGLSGACKSLAIDNIGNLYAGGVFASAGGTTVNNFAKWDGSAWSALIGGTAGVTNVLAGVTNLICLPDNSVILAGDFSNAGGNPFIDYLAKWTGTAYARIGTSPNARVNKIFYDKTRGILYAFGDFTAIGGINANYAAYYDGNNWHAMGGAATASQEIYPTAVINYAGMDANGRVYAFTTFQVEKTGTTNTAAFWDGSKWLLPEFENDKTLTGIFHRALTGQNVIIGYAASGSTTYTLPTVTNITNSTEGNIYPFLTLDATGYNVYSLYNRTTGERIFLNGLRVYTGEKIELIFSPTGYTITSNVRGDMRSSVLSGSSPTFHLQPGDNYVSCFVYPSPAAAVTIPLKYPAQNYISLDETVYA